jgi:TM2 domain-containing membrane protein YozV
MNCTYHPDVPSSAFCQYCGKPLCKDCVRNVGGSIYCEACLAERLRGTGAGAPAAPVFTGTPHPMLAALLGFIPGVGAMYNGQYAKAIAHVLIFAVLASLSDHSGIFGILVAAWVFYQVFDAYQTALARRDGMPLPNPFGLNDIAQRLGIHPHPGMPGIPPMPPVPPPVGGAGWQPVSGPGQAGPAQAGQPQPGPYSGFVPPAGGAGYPPAPGQPGYAEWLENDIRQRSGAAPGAGAGAVAGQPGYGYVPGQPYPPAPPFAPGYGGREVRDIPVAAIILIGLGILFLFGSLGLLHHDWIAHGWPLLIIGLGIWIIFRRTHPPVLPPDPGSIHSQGHSYSASTQSTPQSTTTDPTGGTR